MIISYYVIHIKNIFEFLESLTTENPVLTARVAVVS